MDGLHLPAHQTVSLCCSLDLSALSTHLPNSYLLYPQLTGCLVLSPNLERDECMCRWGNWWLSPVRMIHPGASFVAQTSRVCITTRRLICQFSPSQKNVYAFHSCLCDRCCDFPDSICFCCWVRRPLVIRGVRFLIREVVLTTVVRRSQLGWNHLKTFLLWCTEQLFQTCNHRSWRQTSQFIPFLQNWQVGSYAFFLSVALL